jgi:hypothetical protein
MMNSALSKYFATNPISLICPKCQSKPGADCETSAGAIAMFHVARIKAAARLDGVAKKAR